MPRVTITIADAPPQPYRFDLKREVVKIGRGYENDIIVASGSVSGSHCEMRRVKSGYQLIDLGSTNGIKIDGIRHPLVVLHTGMKVKLGDVDFGFSLTEEELAELASESEPVKEVVKEEAKEPAKLPSADIDEIIKQVSTKKEEAKEEKKEDDGPDKLPPLPAEKLFKAVDSTPESEVKINESTKPKFEDDDDDEEDEEEKAARARREEKKRLKAEKAAKEEKARQAKRAKKEKKADKESKSEDKDEFYESTASKIGSGFILLALIAAAVAFYYGADMRHKKDTGEGILKATVNKEDYLKKAAPEEVDKVDDKTE